MNLGIFVGETIPQLRLGRLEIVVNSGAWIKDRNARRFVFEIIAPGGGGGGGGVGSGLGAAGGGAGAIWIGYADSTDLTDQLNFSIGAAGLGGSGTSSTSSPSNGTAGGAILISDSTGTLVTISGGATNSGAVGGLGGAIPALPTRVFTTLFLSAGTAGGDVSAGNGVSSANGGPTGGGGARVATPGNGGNVINNSIQIAAGGVGGTTNVTNPSAGLIGGFGTLSYFPDSVLRALSSIQFPAILGGAGAGGGSGGNTSTGTTLGGAGGIGGDFGGGGGGGGAASTGPTGGNGGRGGRGTVRIYELL